jgi:hypothetical protein
VARFLHWICSALEFSILAGLLFQRRPTCYALGPLVLAWLVSDLVVALSPASNTWDFWLAKEIVHALLAIGVGIELSLRVLAPVPLGHLAGQRWLAAVAAFCAVLMLTAPPGPASATLVPRLLAAIAWLYLGLALVAARYSVPLTRLHGAVLLALSPYCMLYWLTWSRAEADLATAAVVNPAAFVVVLAVLLWAAWTDDPEPPVEPALVRLVWPWTA